MTMRGVPAKRMSWLLAGSLCLAALAAEPDADLQKQYGRGLKALAAGDTASARDRFEALARRHARTHWASLALWELARIHEHSGACQGAFDALQTLIIQHPADFEKAQAEQFRLVRRLLDTGRESRRSLEPMRPSQAIDSEVICAMLETIIRNGPYSEIGIQAHYYLATAAEKAGRKEDAVRLYEEFLEDHPQHEFADDAGYQMAYIPYKSWKTTAAAGSRDRERAALALSFFLARFPQSDKAAQARSCLSDVKFQEMRELRSLARYYAGRGNAKAAAVYYEQLALKFPQAISRDPELAREIMAASE